MSRVDGSWASGQESGCIKLPGGRERLPAAEPNGQSPVSVTPPRPSGALAQAGEEGYDEGYDEGYEGYEGFWLVIVNLSPAQ